MIERSLPAPDGQTVPNRADDIHLRTFGRFRNRILASEMRGYRRRKGAAGAVCVM